MLIRSHARALALPISARPQGVSLSRLLLIGFAATLLVFVHSAAASAAQPQVGLGTAEPFGLLAGSTITNTGSSIINGQVGLSPGTAVTGFPPGTVNGATHIADAVALQAQADLTVAYNDAAGRKPATAVPADLGGLTVTSGVYKSAAALGLTGTITLDGQGNPNAVFIFQAGSSLTTATSSRVRLINGARACNVAWQVGSSATLGTSTTFNGNLMALSSISVNDSVTVNGRLLARNGAITLINDTVSTASCANSTTTGTGGGGGGGGITTGGGGTSIVTTVPPSVAHKLGTNQCVYRKNFRAIVTGLFIRKVIFQLDGRTIATRTHAPFSATVKPRDGARKLTARVVFSDGTKTVLINLHFRSCSLAGAGFTG